MAHRVQIPSLHQFCFSPTKDASWMTPELKVLQIGKLRRHKKAKEKGRPDLWDRYRQARNQFIAKSRRAKALYYSMKGHEEYEVKKKENSKCFFFLVCNLFSVSEAAKEESAKCESRRCKYYIFWAKTLYTRY